MGVSDAKVSASSTAREQQVGEIAAALPQRAAELSKLFLTRTTISVSRTEIAVLRSLTRRPRRITELAYAESVTQPAITLLVNRLADRGWVRRVPDPTDGRAVLVSLTPTGAEVFERLRSEYRAMLDGVMATLEDEDVETLARAVTILDGLIARLNERHVDEDAEDKKQETH